jgi:predicted DNA-binding protein (UPF0251 family)
VNQDGPNGCWLWVGGRSTAGYGIISHEEHLIGAHRYSWELHNGPIPAGMEILHNCPGGDNPQCVNPVHLLLGTHADNMADAARKGRMFNGEDRALMQRQTAPRGERHWNARLTDESVAVIRERIAQGESHASVARRLGVSRQTVSDVVHGATWRERPER